MKILFFGTSEFALESLKGVEDYVSRNSADTGTRLLGVVTAPDKPAGRGQATRASPVAVYARSKGFSLYQPTSLKDPALWETWRVLAPDLFVVSAYGKILPKALLELPPRGSVNVHPSLLPKYRGAAPVARALLAGETETGVCTLFVVPEVDAGPILFCERVGVAADDTTETLTARLAVLGRALLLKTLLACREGAPVAVPQDESRVVYAPPLEKEEGAINWGEAAVAIVNRVRALTPWPGTWGILKERRIKILRARVSDVAAPSHRPGEILFLSRAAIGVKAGQGVVEIDTLQAEGKKAMMAGDFLNGFSLKIGDCFAEKGTDR